MAPVSKPSNASDQIVAARRLLKSARTADELRQAQAVLLPLELGLSVARTAQAIGRSVGVTSTLRSRFGQPDLPTRPARSTRLRTPVHPELERERQVLIDVLRESSVAGTPSIAQIKSVLEVKLGATMSLSTVYRTLARHGWRKNAPFPAALIEDAESAHAPDVLRARNGASTWEAP